MFMQWGTRHRDRAAKLRARRALMPKNGIAFKKLLIERAAAAQSGKKKPTK